MDFDLGECEYYSRLKNNTDVNLPDGKFHLLTQMEKGDNISVRIRRFTSLKQIVWSDKEGLREYEKYKDGFKNSIFDTDEEELGIKLWKLEMTEFKGNYYDIH